MVQLDQLLKTNPAPRGGKQGRKCVLIETKYEMHQGRRIEVKVYHDMRTHIPWGERTFIPRCPSGHGLKFYRAGMLFIKAKQGDFFKGGSNFEGMIEDLAMGINPNAHSVHRESELEGRT